jgi:tRNA dimethylallyltransferase
VPHHLLDVVEPDQPFSLAEYLSRARSAIRDILSRGRIPLIVGGSGQYVWALVEGWRVPEVPPDPEFRASMERQAAAAGYTQLHAELCRIDPEAAASIQPTNVRRVVRALELFHATGVAPSVLLRQRIAQLEPTLMIGLEVSRPVLYSRIDARVATMIRDGFPDEVRSLLHRGYAVSLPSMSSIGYREMADCVTGKTELSTAMVRIGRETRRLARRQHAWFSPTDERINWLDVDDPSGIVSAAVKLVAGGMR